jgi:hypothetical protein
MIIATVTKQYFDLIGPEYLGIITTVAMAQLGMEDQGIKLGLLLAMCCYFHYIVVCII